MMSHPLLCTCLVGPTLHPGRSGVLSVCLRQVLASLKALSAVYALFPNVGSFCLQSTELGEIKRAEAVTAKGGCTEVHTDARSCCEQSRLPSARQGLGAADTNALVSAKELAGKKIPRGSTLRFCHMELLRTTLFVISTQVLCRQKDAF